MIRRIIDDEKRYRKENNKKKQGHPLEAWVFLIPIAFAVFALSLMFLALRSQATMPVRCVDKFSFLQCDASVVIGVVSTSKEMTMAAKETWVKVARGMGMTVVFFGDHSDADLPMVSLRSSPKDAMAVQVEVWQWLYYQYGSYNNWFLQVYDSTLVHPYFLTRILCSRNAEEPWYIGESGSSSYVRNLRFAGAHGGYLLSIKSVRAFLTAWEEELCKEKIAPDVTLGNCMQFLSIDLVGTAFYPHQPVSLFRSTTEFITIGHLNPSSIQTLSQKSFDHCKYHKI